MTVDRRRTEHVTLAQHQELVDSINRLHDAFDVRNDLISRIDERQGSMLATVNALVTQNTQMHDRQVRMEHCQHNMAARLTKHYTEEHRDFSSVVRFIDNARFSFVVVVALVIGLAGITAAAAGVWDWILNHLPKEP